MKESKLTKSDIMISDIVYIIFTILAAFCFVAIAVVSAFSIACACVSIVKAFSFTAASHIAYTIILSVLVLGVCALFIYLDYLIFVSVKRGISRYLTERKEALSQNN